MEGGTLAQLAAKLLAAIASLTDYAVPAEPPRIALVPHAQLERMACGEPCRVYGWFPPGETIYLDQRLDLRHDPGAQSILLHELVHYVQQKSGTFPAGDGCERWLAREWEAYDIQLRWLAERRAPKTALSRYGFRPASLTCVEDEGAASEPAAE